MLRAMSLNLPTLLNYFAFAAYHDSLQQTGSAHYWYVSQAVVHVFVHEVRWKVDTLNTN